MNPRVKVLVEIALAVALSGALNLVGARLPWNVAGGRVALDMVPIFIVAFRHGVGAGMIAGALWGAFDLLFDPFIVHPVQVFLDYPLAFALCGLAGLGKRRVDRALVSRQYPQAGFETIPWVLLGGAARYLVHVVSGVVFFAEYAEGQPVIAYSLIYNVSYLGPSLAASAVVVAVLVPALAKALPRVDRSA